MKLAGKSVILHFLGGILRHSLNLLKVDQDRVYPMREGRNLRWNREDDRFNKTRYGRNNE